MIASGNSIALGHLYESHVFNVLLRKIPSQQLKLSSRHLNVPIQKLKATNMDKEESFEIDYPKHVAYFENMETINPACSDTIYIPVLVEQNKEAVDMVFPPYLIQITSAKYHSVSPEGITSVLKSFPSLAGTCKMVFIIPRNRLQIFTSRKKIGMNRYTLVIDFLETMSCEEFKQMDRSTDETDDQVAEENENEMNN